MDNYLEHRGLDAAYRGMCSHAERGNEKGCNSHTADAEEPSADIPVGGAVTRLTVSRSEPGRTPRTHLFLYP